MASAIIVLLHMHVCCCVFVCFVMMDDRWGGFCGVVLIIFLMVSLSISCVRCKLLHHICDIVGPGGGIYRLIVIFGENVGVVICMGAWSNGSFSCLSLLQWRKCWSYGARAPVMRACVCACVRACVCTARV